jgi:hypothetical protein
VIFHGRRGELRQRYREGQEDQLGALGLVVNLVVQSSPRKCLKTDYQAGADAIRRSR